MEGTIKTIAQWKCLVSSWQKVIPASLTRHDNIELVDAELHPSMRHPRCEGDTLRTHLLGASSQISVLMTRLITVLMIRSRRRMFQTQEYIEGAAHRYPVECSLAAGSSFLSSSQILSSSRCSAPVCS